MNRSAILAAPLLLTLSACMTGGNIKGDFQCKAPGGTCAPMSAIDAGAVASIGSFRSISEPGIDTPSLPRPLTGPVLADGSAPPRTSDRVLRVVFPAHVDRDGIYREEAAAHAVVENAAWADALGARPAPARGVPALRASGIVPASAAGSVLATMDEIVAARAANAASAASGATSTVVAPTAAPAAVQLAPLVPARSFDTASRSMSPMSLAEAAAGLSAPRLAALDPREPAANYDTPDVTAVRQAVPRAAPATALAAAKSSIASPTASPTVSPTAPYGTRTVRWKGRSYQVPYKSPQPASATASPVAAPQPNRTADLNKAALSKTTTTAPSPASAPAVGTTAAAAVPIYGPTSDASEAGARLKAMAAPVLLGAVEQGREAARDAAPQGFALPLPSRDLPR